MPDARPFIPGRPARAPPSSAILDARELPNGYPERWAKSDDEDPFIVNPTTTTTTAARGTKRAFNFNAGPAALPLSVLERMRDELLDYAGTGMSVMELSHRSPEFEAISDTAERTLRRVLSIPDDYAVSFLQGGGSLQFAMVPMNLWVPGKPVDVLHTGAWTAKAIEELKKIAQYRLAASTEADKFTRVPKPSEISLDPNASYVAMCTNNTIEGSQWSYVPETSAVPLVADMSSDIASKPIEVRKFGMIFAGAQKNLGPSGATVIILRRDLAERANDKIAKILQYRTQIKEKSLYHTPATFSVYTMGLVLNWIEAEGGVVAIEKRNAAKAKLLYDTIDGSGGYYRCPVERDSRSVMNVMFRVSGGEEAVESRFVTEAEAARIAGIKGHRSVGGMRASIYNAVTMETVETLVAFMREFQRKNG
jgi:phosphoserine aminotransferase